jgi:hypothetical protein
MSGDKKYFGPSPEFISEHRVGIHRLIVSLRLSEIANQSMADSPLTSLDVQDLARYF